MKWIKEKTFWILRDFWHSQVHKNEILSPGSYENNVTSVLFKMCKCQSVASLVVGVCILVKVAEHSFADAQR